MLAEYADGILPSTGIGSLSQIKTTSDPNIEEKRMAQTGKYCKDCLDKLSPATAKTPEDRAMLRAHQFIPGSHPLGKGPEFEDGICGTCKKKEIIMFYED
jgi:hypothetical protein